MLAGIFITVVVYHRVNPQGWSNWILKRRLIVLSSQEKRTITVTVAMMKYRVLHTELFNLEIW